MIKKVAVLGSGVMGSGIAAHLANCGIPSYLLDVIPPNLSKKFSSQPREKELCSTSAGGLK